MNRIKLSDIKWLLVLLCLPFVSSCKDDLEAYEEAEITSVGAYHRYYTTEKDALTGEFKVAEKELEKSNSINEDEAVVTATFTVPAASGSFTDAERAKVSLNKLVVYFNVSTAARVTPLDGSPKLGAPGDWTSERRYSVMAANGTKKTWIVNVNPGCYFGGSATQYFIGDFDGTRFICDSKPDVTKWLDWGKDHYATVSFSNMGRRVIVVPWMSNWQYCNNVPTKPFRGVNALPRELGLYTQSGDIYLSAAPVAEVKNLRKETKEIPAFTVANDYHIESLLPDNEGAYELSLDITAEKAEIIGFSLFNDKGEKVDIYFNLPERKLVMDRTKSGIVDFGKNSVTHEIEVHDRRKTTSINYIDDFALATWAPVRKENKYRLDIFVDKCSVEIFLNEGKIAMSNLVFPTEPYNRMCFYSKGGTFKVDTFKVHRLSL